jgi:hypothetical protein
MVMRPLPGLQISYVLPITATDFSSMLQRFNARSNMVARRYEPTWTIQKLADEGSTSPFMARLYIGLFQLRDTVYYDPGKRDAFDKRFDVVLSSWTNARMSEKTLMKMWNDHLEKIASGKIARLDGQSIRIDEPIDRELKKEVESFINASVRALKQGMQILAKQEFGLDIGFLFKKQPAFEAGVAAMRSTDAPLADYLEQTRTWSETLVESRNDIEHDGWMLPRVGYTRQGVNIVASEPSVRGMPFSAFAMTMLDRLCCFIEEFTTHCFQGQFPAELTITELPLNSREQVMPLRFRLTPVAGGLPRWNLRYHVSSFENT